MNRKNRKKSRIRRRIRRRITLIAIPIAYRRSLARIAGSVKALVIRTVNRHGT